MSCDNKRIKGRAIIEKYNAHILFSLIGLGFFFSCLIVSTALLFFSKSFLFLLLIGLFSFVIRSLFKHIKNVSLLKKEIEEKMYTTADKHYIWDLETTRDRLMARLIQEKICPWSSNNSCYKPEECRCKKQSEILIQLNYDTNSSEKVVLRDIDERT